MNFQKKMSGNQIPYYISCIPLQKCFRSDKDGYKNSDVAGKPDVPDGYIRTLPYYGRRWNNCSDSLGVFWVGIHAAGIRVFRYLYKVLTGNTGLCFPSFLKK